MLLSPTAWRRKFFVRRPADGGPHPASRHRQSPGEQLGRARIGLKDRGLRSKDVPRPSVPSQLILHCARIFWPLCTLAGSTGSRCDAAGAGPDRHGLRRARRGFPVMTFFSKALSECFSQPTGRKVPAGACAGGSRVTPGVGQAMRAARACWSGRRRARQAAAAG